MIVYYSRIFKNFFYMIVLVLLVDISVGEFFCFDSVDWNIVEVRVF